MTAPFDIFEINEPLLDTILSNPITLHKHTYEEVLVLTAGTPIHLIDFRKEIIQTPAIAYVPSGRVHQFIPDLSTRGYAVRFSCEFIPENSLKFYSNFIDAVNTRFSENECTTQIESLCKLMVNEFSTKQPDLKTIQHLLSALISKIENLSNSPFKREDAIGNAKVATFHNFLRLLELNFTESKSVDFYADKLFMTTRNLNNICNSISGDSIGDLIEKRKVIEAKRLLLETTDTVSEIGFKLGFNEKSYFSRVFKKRAGLTPSDFREKMTDLMK